MDQGKGEEREGEMIAKCLQGCLSSSSSILLSREQYIYQWGVFSITLSQNEKNLQKLELAMRLRIMRFHADMRICGCGFPHMHICFQ